MRLTYSIADQNLASAASIGIYNISVGLMRALTRHPALEHMTVLTNPSIPPEAHPDAKIEVLSYGSPVAHTRGRLTWDQWGCYRAASRVGNPWLFLPKGFGSFVRGCPVSLAVYLHDMTSVIYRERYPGTVPIARHLYYIWTHRQTLKHARLVFTNTDFSRREIAGWAERHRISCPPVIVAGYGFDHRWPTRPRSKQILVDVRSSPHKRTDLALNFVARWHKASGYDGRIVCAGTLPARIRAPDAPGWNYVGKVSPARHLELMAESQALVHFTEHEGFGMPPVEAILAGTAPVYSLIPVTGEVMGDVGCPFRNDDYASFADAMEKALNTSAETIAAWADVMEKRHHWSLVAGRILSALKEHGPA
ncbi:MAG TPA: glycosyltransferase [Kiritimatiellia bacterium]|nr:glycosyltransferase [Kiritimatiellia bacterium]